MAELGLEVKDFEVVDTYVKYFQQVELLWDEKKLWNDFLDKNWEKSLCLFDLEKTRKYLEGLSKKLLIMQRELDPNEVVQGLKTKL